MEKRNDMLSTVQDLMERSLRKGWDISEIDRRLAELNENASRAVKMSLIREWRKLLE